MSISSTRTPQMSLWSHLDRDFLRSFWTVAIPITLQTILFSSKGLVDILMIGQLSEADVAATGVAVKALFVATILLSGIATGGAMLAAQHFGAKDNSGLRSSIALTWLMSTLVALIPVALFLTCSQQIMGVATSDLDVITLGQEYLSIAGFSLLFMAYQSSIAAGLRSMHQASTATFFSGLGIVLNILFNWILIFGHLGAPALGLKGAAIATLLSAVIESLLLFVFLQMKKHILVLTIPSFNSCLNIASIKRFLALALPTTGNFLLWAMGVFAYTAIMGYTGTEGLVVLSIISPIEAFSLSLLTGIANASAVVVGNNLGAKNYSKAYHQAILYALFAALSTIIVATILYLNMENVLALFGAISSESYLLAQSFYLILCIGIVFRTLPTVMVVGVLRAGGDVKFCLYQDLLTQWCFGLPIAAICAIWLKLPADIIFITFFFEALFKWFACIHRFRSKKWMNDLVNES